MPGENENQDTQDQIDFDDEQRELGESDQQQSAGDAAAVAEASAKGWVPKDQYTGDPAKWVDAATFVERGNNFNANLKKKVSSLEAQLASFKGTAEAFKKFHAEAMAGKQKELDSALTQLKREHREAIREGDDDAADALEGRMEVLRQEKITAAAEVVEAPAENAQTPELKAWVEDGNEWFESDKKLQTYALGVAQELVTNGEKLRGRAFLDKVTEIMREEFPAKFSNPNRRRAGMSEAGGKAAIGIPGRTERDLPAADRQLMRDFVSAGWTTKEKFLAEYRWN